MTEKVARKQALAVLHAIAGHHSNKPSITLEPDWRAQEAAPELSLLGLPAEIRLQVYSYLLVDEHENKKPLNPTARTFNHGLQPAIMSTCRQVRLETLPLLYGRNTFSIDLFSTSDYKAFSTFLCNLHIDGLAWIQNLTVCNKMLHSTACPAEHGCGNQHIFNVNYALDLRKRTIISGSTSRDYNFLSINEMLAQPRMETIATTTINYFDTPFNDLPSIGMGAIGNSKDSSVGGSKKTKWSRFKDLAAVVEIMCTQQCKIQPETQRLRGAVITKTRQGGWNKLIARTVDGAPIY